MTSTISRLSPYVAICITAFVLMACAKKYHLSDASQDSYIIESPQIPDDQRITAMIAPYKEELSKIMSEQIGVAGSIMLKDRPESTLGNWFADIVQRVAEEKSSKKIDFSIQNYGGIRVRSLNAGPITVGEIFEIMPFENQMVIMETRGIVVRELLSHIARKGGWPVSKEVKVLANKDGQLKIATIGGKEIDPVKTYRFAIPDYIANGGDATNFLKNQPREELGIKIRDGVIEYLRKTGKDSPENASIEQRFTYYNWDQ